ncbi:MAG: hypothetical protein A2293_14145 [Elusimicrobia bacterium RIFOXYB2_FULL_49_7]|nr:MAG: hypothetical protein A2293_14145 [Elusimicrobia bacterium RIFOXYB2_FULL_49_7]
MSEMPIYSKPNQIVHDINSTLFVMTQKVFQIRQRYPECKEKIDSELEAIEQCCYYVRDMLHLLANNHKRSRAPAAELCVNTTLKTLVELFLKGFMGVTYDLTVDPHDKKVSIPRDEFHRLIQNILMNALEAMNNKGHLSISTKIVQLKAAPAENPADEYINISIKDTGLGIPVDILPTLTDEGVSTKGEARGLGLSIVKDIAGRYNGRLEIESEEGVGTTIHIFLPTLKNHSEQLMPEAAIHS